MRRCRRGRGTPGRRRRASARSANPATAVTRCAGVGCRRTSNSVITPSVPSAPTNSESGRSRCCRGEPRCAGAPSSRRAAPPPGRPPARPCCRSARSAARPRSSTPFRRPSRNREPPGRPRTAARRRGRALHGGQRHAGPEPHPTLAGVNVTDRREPFGGQQHVVVLGNSAGHQRRSAALDRHVRTRVPARGQHRSDLVARPGTHQRGRVAAVTAGVVDAAAVQHVGIGADVPAAHHGGQFAVSTWRQRQGTRPGRPVRRVSTAGTRSAVADRTMTRRTCARLTATLSRFLLSRNEIPRGTSSIDDAVIETNTTGACLPWNLSTVPARDVGESCRVEVSPQHHHLRVVRRDDQHVVLAPAAGCRLRRSMRSRAMRRISSTIASASSGLSVELPSCSTSQHPDPGRVAVEMPCGGDGFVGAQPAVVGQPRHRPAHRGMHAVRAVQEVAASLAAACGGLRPASPAPSRRPVRDGVPWLTWGSCCGSPSSSRLAAARATAMVLARLNWPASSITSRSRLPAATRLSLAKSHAVPPITQPVVCGDEPGVVRPGRSPATGRPRRAVLLGDPLRVDAGLDDIAEQVLDDRM